MFAAIRDQHDFYRSNPIYWGLLAFNIVMWGLVIPARLIG